MYFCKSLLLVAFSIDEWNETAFLMFNCFIAFLKANIDERDLASVSFFHLLLSCTRLLSFINSAISDFLTSMVMTL